jgi:Sulfotransferase domain
MKSLRLRMPDFIGVGPPRTGTTWLHESLRDHVCLPRIKEIHFFKWHYSKGLRWYAQHFRNCSRNLPVGEFCPSYFNFVPARERILNDLPNCKIICTLRDPVERLYSHYRMMRPVWGTSASFEEALIEYPDITDASRYAKHVRAWQDAFGESRVLILFYDDLKSNPQGYLDAACSFIGIPKIDLNQTRIGARKTNEVKRLPRSRHLALASSLVVKQLRSHRFDLILDVWRRSGLRDMCTGGGEEYAPISPETEPRLREYFQAEIEDLERLTGRNLCKWKQAGMQPAKAGA